jgi:hypothetical protein
MVHSAPTLLGSVTVDEAVLGATIRVFDKQGNLLYEQENATEGFEGRFIISEDHTLSFPMEFRVVASGGTHKDEPFEGDLMCDAEKWPVDTLGLNPATSLIARYRDYHPDIPPAEAQRRVRRFLMIPAEKELVGHLKPYFSGDEFLRRAASMGGVNAFIDTLVLAVDDESGIPFIPFVPVKAAGGGLAKALLGEIGKGVLQSIGFHAFGALIESIFPDQTQAKLDEIISAVEALRSEVFELGETLKIEIRTTTLEEYISHIDQQFDKYQWVIKQDPETLTEVEKQNREKIILDIKAFAEENFENYIKFISNQMLKGTVADPRSLLDIWTDTVIRETANKGLYGPLLKSSSFYDTNGESALRQYEKIESLVLYLTYAQSRAALILAELYGAYDQPLSLRYLQEKLYRKCMEEQAEQFTKCAEKFVLSSPWMLQQDTSEYFLYDAHWFRINSPYPSYPFNPVSLIYTEFAPDKRAQLDHILPRADRLAGDLLARPSQWVFRFLHTIRIPKGRGVRGTLSSTSNRSQAIDFFERWWLVYWWENPNCPPPDGVEYCLDKFHLKDIYRASVGGSALAYHPSEVDFHLSYTENGVAIDKVPIDNSVWSLEFERHFAWGIPCLKTAEWGWQHMYSRDNHRLYRLYFTEIPDFPATDPFVTGFSPADFYFWYPSQDTLVWRGRLAFDPSLYPESLRPKKDQYSFAAKPSVWLAFDN